MKFEFSRGSGGGGSSLPPPSRSTHVKVKKCSSQYVHRLQREGYVFWHVYNFLNNLNTVLNILCHNISLGIKKLGEIKETFSWNSQKHILSKIFTISQNMLCFCTINKLQNKTKKKTYANVKKKRNITKLSHQIKYTYTFWYA